MRYGLCAPNFGTYTDPRAVATLAAAAERSGWDGLFVWDHLAFVWDGASADPWLLLAAAALSTSRLRVGTAVTPVARRRPHVLAQTVATLDVMSGGGRVVLGAGLGGVPREFSAFGEPHDERVRAEMLDEGLDLMRALWAGGKVQHAGRHYLVDGVAFAPACEIPIWIGGNSARALRRAARFDGWIADSAGEQEMTLSPEAIQEKVEAVRAGRSTGAPFDVAVLGYSDALGRDTCRAYERAGATWWLESVHDRRGGQNAMLALVEAGPPGC